MTQLNPVQDFWQYAEKIKLARQTAPGKQEHVRAHLRKTENGPVVVDAYDRDAGVVAGDAADDAAGGAGDVVVEKETHSPGGAGGRIFSGDTPDASALDELEGAEASETRDSVGGTAAAEQEGDAAGGLVGTAATGAVISEHDIPKPVAVLDRNGLKASEMELWRRWKDGGQKPEDVAPLLKSFKPLINSRSSTYKGRVKLIPDAAIDAEFQIRFVDALRTYNPDKGSLGTYVYRYLDKAKRFIAENQNVGRIPENRIYKIKEYQKAREAMTEDLGRVPTDKDLAKKLKWSEAEVGRMDSELRNDLLSQGFEDDPYALSPSKSEEVLRLFKYELVGKEREVYEYLTGFGRPQLLSTGEIAKQTGMADYQVSRVKDSIQRKLQRHLRDDRRAS